MRTLMASLWFALLILAAADAAAARDAPASAYLGRWALQMDGRNLFILDLKAGAGAGSGAGTLTGALTWPTNFQINTSNDEISKVTLPLAVTPIVEAGFDNNGSLRFVVHDPQNPKDTDTFLFKVSGRDYGGLIIAGARMRTLPMNRVGPDATASSAWDPDRVYAPDDHHTTNPEMTRLFDEDQAARKVDRIDWSVVSKADAARRAQTLDLLNQGKLHTGADFLHAAFVFQHGDRPGDYLLAHTLALAAVKRGRSDASWIAAATLDRYLQTIGQPQIYGTQFTIKQGAPATQAPMDGKLIPDSLRLLLGVPALAQQAPPPSQVTVP